jgi:energy-coupling factor transport system permease protein
MSRYLLAYTKGNSPIHFLAPAVKFLLFLLWSILTMVGFDTRIMLGMCLVGFMLFIISGIKFRDVRIVYILVFAFLTLNLIMIYLFAPEQGVIIYHTRHLITEGIGRYTLTWEQLFYEFNIFLKHLIILPPAIVLIVTTHPSEFAASLNRIGVPYSIAYAVSLTLRYIPDVQRDFFSIFHAHQARGIEISRKVSLLKRFKGVARILLPLIFSSLDRIDVISHAMELRSFGKYKKRTWYSYHPFTLADKVVLITGILIFVFGIWFTFRDGTRFYNPFL